MSERIEKIKKLLASAVEKIKKQDFNNALQDVETALYMDCTNQLNSQNIRRVYVGRVVPLETEKFLEG